MKLKRYKEQAFDKIDLDVFASNKKKYENLDFLNNFSSEIVGMLMSNNNIIDSLYNLVFGHRRRGRTRRVSTS